MSVDQPLKPLEGPWKGDSKIVIGIDIGTTCSGVACTFLEKGQKQLVHRVVKWPGQEADEERSKIPTVVWYDSNDKAVSFGAEALSPQAEEDAEDNGWTLAKNFKLHLHPYDMTPKHGFKLDTLPPGVSLRQIYADFLGYLLQHTKSYFEERIVDGKLIWAKYSSEMEVVIAHPNGWGIQEQKFLRGAAVAAGFVNDTSASTKIRFVTEAEASVHYCLHHTNLEERLEVGMNFIVCDAGGSTIDTTVYSITSTQPVLKLEEKRDSACVQAGGIFVDAEAEKHLRSVFRNARLSPEDIDEYVKNGIKEFESYNKRAFRDPAGEQQVKIADRRLNNIAINTRRGYMTLTGATMKSFFNLCVEEILASVGQQMQGLTISHILLVGGFGDSPHLRREFKEHYEPQGSQITPINNSTSKAVADGAVIWSTISSVYSRAPRSSFGIISTELFESDNPEHQVRLSYMDADGRRWISGGWSQIALKGVPLDVKAVCRKSFYRTYDSPTPDLNLFEVDLYSHPGEDEPERGYDKEGDLLPRFRLVCTIEADLSGLSGALIREFGPLGSFWSLEFDVCMRFGGTEPGAFLEWKENETNRTGPVAMIAEELVLP